MKPKSKYSVLFQILKIIPQREMVPKKKKIVSVMDTWSLLYYSVYMVKISVFL